MSQYKNKIAQSLVRISPMTESEQRPQNLLFLRPWKDGRHTGGQPTPLQSLSSQSKAMQISPA